MIPFEKTCQTVINEVFSGKGVQLTPLVDRVFDCIPPTLRHYVAAEKAYIKRSIRTIDIYLDELQREKQALFADNPQQVLEMRVKDLFQFADQQKQGEFMHAARQCVEDSAYALEVVVLEAYEIYEIKSNVPIIGYFWRRGLKNALGTRTLPTREESLDYIRKQQVKAFQLLKMFGVEEGSPSSRQEIAQRYQQHIRNRWKEIRSDNYESGVLRLENAPYPDRNDLTREQQFTRSCYYISSRYNSLLEKVIGYVGALFTYLFRGSDEQNNTYAPSQA